MRQPCAEAKKDGEESVQVRFVGPYPHHLAQEPPLSNVVASVRSTGHLDFISALTYRKPTGIADWGGSYSLP